MNPSLMRNQDAGKSSVRGSLSGALFLWDDSALFLGTAPGADAHASHTLRVCIAIQGSFLVRSSEESQWNSYHAAIIPPDQPYQLSTEGAQLCVLHLIPESSEARLLSRAFAVNRVRGVRQDVVRSVMPRLRAYLEHGCNDDEAFEITRETVSKLVGDAQPHPALDGRVMRTVEYLRSTSERSLTLSEIADGAALSPSRFAHLFRAEAGIPLQRYLLWLRLRDAIRQAASGLSITEVAHAVGFADSAHLTRTFRRMLGITPSSLLRNCQVTHLAR